MCIKLSGGIFKPRLWTQISSSPFLEANPNFLSVDPDNTNIDDTAAEHVELFP